MKFNLERMRKKKQNWVHIYQKESSTLNLKFYFFFFLVKKIVFFKVPCTTGESHSEAILNTQKIAVIYEQAVGWPLCKSTSINRLFLVVASFNWKCNKIVLWSPRLIGYWIKLVQSWACWVVGECYVLHWTYTRLTMTLLIIMRSANLLNAWLVTMWQLLFMFP